VCLDQHYKTESMFLLSMAEIMDLNLTWMYHKAMSLFGHVDGMTLYHYDPIRSLSYYNVHKIVLNYNMTRFGWTDLFNHLSTIRQ